MGRPPPLLSSELPCSAIWAFVPSCWCPLRGKCSEALAADFVLMFYGKLLPTASFSCSNCKHLWHEKDPEDFGNFWGLLMVVIGDAQSGQLGLVCLFFFIAHSGELDNWSAKLTWSWGSIVARLSCCHLTKVLSSPFNLLAKMELNEKEGSCLILSTP